jgi:hypothetical protein
MGSLISSKKSANTNTNINSIKPAKYGFLSKPPDFE